MQRQLRETIMFLQIFIMILLNITNALENADYEESNNFINASCISKYRDLEAYVLNSKDVMDNLTETFFKTGRPLTQYVRITYIFKVSLSSSSSNITNNYTIEYHEDVDTNSSDDDDYYYDYDNDNDNDEYKCTDDQTEKLFIWSSSGLYLLGPKSLFWMTLFAVHVAEEEVTIHLPCLCELNYDNLLSRLTYFIKVYPAMQYGEDAMMFISTYYFETKNKDESNYRIIVIIFAVSIFFPLATFTTFAYLAFFHSKWIAEQAAKYLKGNDEIDQTSEEDSLASISDFKDKDNEKEMKDESRDERKLSSLEAGLASGDDSLNVGNTDDNETSFMSPSSDENITLNNSNVPPSQENTKDLEIDKTTSCDAIDTQDDKSIVSVTHDQEYRRKRKSNKQKKLKKRLQKKKDHKIRRINVLALSLTFLLLSIALLAFHVLASMNLIDYGNEILFDAKNINRTFDIKSSHNKGLLYDDQSVPIIYVVISFLPTTFLTFGAFVTYIYICLQLLNAMGIGPETESETFCAKCLYGIIGSCFYCSKCCKYCKHKCKRKCIECYKCCKRAYKGADSDSSDSYSSSDDYSDTSYFENLYNKALQNKDVEKIDKLFFKYDMDETIGIILQVSLGGFLVYLGFYFLPFMTLAFIYDPIQTGFIYLMSGSFAFSMFANIKAVVTVAAVCMKLLPNNHFGIPKLIFVTASGISIAYFLVIFIFILTLGNFHDFQAIQNLTLPLIIGLLSLFAFKPFTKYAKSGAKNELDLLNNY